MGSMACAEEIGTEFTDFSKNATAATTTIHTSKEIELPDFSTTAMSYFRTIREHQYTWPCFWERKWLFGPAEIKHNYSPEYVEKNLMHEGSRNRTGLLIQFEGEINEKNSGIFNLSGNRLRKFENCKEVESPNDAGAKKLVMCRLNNTFTRYNQIAFWADDFERGTTVLSKKVLPMLEDLDDYLC